MPSIDVTMAGESIAVEVNGAGYTDRQARAALDDETVTPGQVGTDSDRTDVYGDVVDTREVSVSEASHDIFPTGETATLKPVVALTDNDNTTPLSMDTGSLPETYDVLLVEGVITGHSGTSSFENLQGTVNNYTDSGYSSNLRGGGSNSASHWIEGFRNPGYLSLKWRIEAHNDFDGVYARPISVRSTSSGHDNQNRLIDGYLSASENPVNSLQLSTPSNAVGYVNVYGKTLR